VSAATIDHALVDVGIDLVAHGGPSAAGPFTGTIVDIATGLTDCLPLVACDGSQAFRPAQPTGTTRLVSPG